MPIPVQKAPSNMVFYRIQVELRAGNIGLMFTSEPIHSAQETVQRARALAPTLAEGEVYILNERGQGVAWVYADKPATLFAQNDAELLQALRAPTNTLARSNA